MSSNQIGGFFSTLHFVFRSPPPLFTLFVSFSSSHQLFLVLPDRLEGSRKYLFGCEANNSLISGVLVLRGLDHKAVVDVAPDWESYEYKRLDIDGSREDKEFFEAALAWDLSVDSKAWADGKNVSHTPLTFVMILQDLLIIPLFTQFK